VQVRCTEANQEVKGDNLRNIIEHLLSLVRLSLVEKEYFATVISDIDLQDLFHAVPKDQIDRQFGERQLR
jgi:hypothetical protein